MQINSTHQIHGTQGLNGPHFNNRPHGRVEGPGAQPVDQVEISPAAQAASQTEQAGGIRADLVAQLRAEIQSGTYETAEKLEQAVDRMFDSIG